MIATNKGVDTLPAQSQVNSQPSHRLASMRERAQFWAAWIDSIDVLKPGLEPNLAWLARLRWAVVLGQSITIGIVHWGMGFPMPMSVVLSLIGLTAVSNIGLQWRAGSAIPMRRSLFVHVLLFDTLTLTGLLACTGGVHNPFATLYLVHVAMAAVALGSAAAWGMAVTVTLCYSALLMLAGPHAYHEMISEPLHLKGMVVSTSLTAGCIAYFVSRLNRELRNRERALGEMRLLREQNERFVALATLAAGVAHELGSPLGTIAISARELERSAAASDVAACKEDAGLIREEVERCRVILGRLNAESTNQLGEPASSLLLADLLDTAAAGLPNTYRSRLDIQSPVDAQLFLPGMAVAEALRMLISNAFQASSGTARVLLSATPGTRNVVFAIHDSGAGLTGDARIHATEPFFTTKEPGNGMGLGLYLVRLLAERLGGSFELRRNQGPGVTAELSLPLTAPAKPVHH